MEVSEAQQELPRPSNGDPIVSPNGKPKAHGQYDAGSINAQCVVFMQCVNQHLGDHSPEWQKLQKALGDFQKGRLSKREAYGTMMVSVGDNEDLKQGLLEILSHEQASWGPGDFDPQLHNSPQAAESVPSHVEGLSQPAGLCSFSSASPGANIEGPAFLQPEHQSQMRLPPISTAWDPREFDMPHAINPVLFRSPLTQNTQERSAPLHRHDIVNTVKHEHQDYTSYDTQEIYGDHGQNYQAYAHHPQNNWNTFSTNEISPSEHLSPTEIPSAQPYPLPSFGPTTTFPYENSGYSADYSSPNLGAPERAGRTSYLPNEIFQEHTARESWPNARYYQPYEGLQPHRGQYHAQSPTVSYQISTSSMASSLHDSPHDSPSTWGTPLAVAARQPRHEEMAPPPANRGLEVRGHPVALDPVPPFPGNRQATAKQPRSRAAMGLGKFVHGLCGKGFHSRSAVKKHHWGHARAGDTSTTTGCWAKKNKPNREWDEHPSCKPDNPTTRATKSFQAGSKAPMVPTMIANPDNLLPGFPTLDHLPDTVAGAVNAMPVFDGQPIPYNTARLPMMNSFESLLTAVNAVVEVDAPKPQGRNDSVVSYLDAQAAAAEHNSRSLLAAGYEAQDGRGTYRPQEPSQIVGLGITHCSDIDQPVSSEVQEALSSPRTEPMGAPVGHALLESDSSRSLKEIPDKSETKRGYRTSARRLAASKH